MINSIMVVDDSATALKFVSLMLEKNGLNNVRMAKDALAALDMVEAEVPDLFILDVLMPGMDGIELCKRLRSLPETANVPVIIVSALGDPTSVAAGFEAGANDYMSKPLTQNDLVKKVRGMLGMDAA